MHIRAPKSENGETEMVLVPGRTALCPRSIPSKDEPSQVHFSISAELLHAGRAFCRCRFAIYMCPQDPGFGCCVWYPTRSWKFSTAGSWYPSGMVMAGAGTARALSFPTSFLSFWDPNADTLRVRVPRAFLLPRMRKVLWQQAKGRSHIRVLLQRPACGQSGPGHDTRGLQ